MTIGGFLIRDWESAWVWADAECYDDRDPAGERSKVHVNPLGCFAGTGAGNTGFIELAAGALHRVTSVDAAVLKLPRVLATDTDAVQRNYCFGVAGLSFEFKRMVGYRFDGAAAFAEQMCSFAAWPLVPSVQALNPHDPCDLIPIAIEQMRKIRIDHRWSGLALVVAQISPDRITTVRFPDFGDRVRGVAPIAGHDMPACVENRPAAASRDVGHGGGPPR